MVTAVSAEKEDILALTLAITGSDTVDHHIRKKRKRKTFSGEAKANCVQGFEGKVYALMRARDDMLKIKEGSNCGNQVIKRSRAPLMAADHPPAGNTGGKDLHLFHLLLITATAISECNAAVALENLADLYRSVSLVGDSVQRVVAYFADGLVVKLLRAPDHSSFLDRIVEQPTKKEEFLAFTFMYRASPYYQFAHFTANQAIVEAFEREEKTNNRELHVIDFDVSYGFQWPSLIQSLSEKGRRILFRLTGYGRSKEELHETELRLINFAKPFSNVTFRFKGLLNGTEAAGLRVNKTETLAVNFVFPLGILNQNLKKSETLKLVHSMKPSIVVGVEQQIHRSPRSFFSRFMASLHYFAAMFDSLDGCFPAGSSERLTIERSLLGKEIMRTTVDSDGVDDGGGRGLQLQKYARMETWKGKMEGSGFRETALSSKCLMQARLLLKIRTQSQSQYCCGGSEGFRVVERNESRSLSLVWQDQSLLTVSLWQS